MSASETMGEHDPAALIERAEASYARQDPAAARDCYAAALPALRNRVPSDGSIVRALVGFGWTLLALDDAEAALQLQQEALAEQLRIAPQAQAAVCTIRRSIAAALTATGQLEAALEQHRQVLGIQRALPAAEQELAETCNILGETAARLERYAEARDFQEQALVLLRRTHPAGAPQIAAALTNLGVSLYRLDAPEAAETCLREALAIDPDLLLAAENLIHVLYQQGRKAEGRALAAEKYRRRSFVVQPPPPRPVGTLLVLWSLDGNIPKQHLLARLPMTVVDWHIQYAGADHERQLPPYDAVFNLIGDADQGAAALAAAVAFRQRCEVALLNDPRKVQRTRRDLIPELLAGIEGLVVPRIVRLSSAELRDAAARARAIAGAGVAMPLLLRNAGMHGGDSVQLVFDDGGLAQAAIESGDDQTFYATAYHDYGSADGFYRKYRAVFVNRVPLPYHLAISRDWLVHYFSADMLAHPWKLEEERRYLEDAAGVLGGRAWAVLGEIARRMDLDYCGVDFSLLADGRVLLFEANATMLVHPEQDPTLQHKNAPVARIFSAFDALVLGSLSAAKRGSAAARSR